MATSTRSQTVTVSTLERQACPECSGRVRPDGTDRTCTDCGLVVTSTPTAHPYAYAASYDPERREQQAASKATDRDLGDRGLGSQLAFGPHASPRERRLERWHRQAANETHVDRNRAYATVEIGRMAAALDLGDGVTAAAKRRWRELHERNLVLGRDMDTLAATCVYTTARVRQRGVTAAEVADVAHASQLAIERRHTWLRDALDVLVPPPDPAQRLRRVGAGVDVPEHVIRRALSRLDGLDGAAVSGGSPSTLAAALLYDAAGGGVTQETVCEAAGVSATGMRKRLERLG